MIRRGLKKVIVVLAMSGIDLVQFFNSIRGIPLYVRDYRRLKKQKSESSLTIEFGSAYPCLGDRFSESGSARGHYFHQDLLVARKIFMAQPKKHVDIGSRVDGFVAHVASYREIEVFDIRPLSSTIPNITFVQCDLMNSQAARKDYCDSLSCLHALEHFGLGRYGDPVNYEGHVEGFNNLKQILRNGGVLYFSVPIGPQRIEFNGHRVFSLTYLLSLFGDDFSVEDFSYVDDAGELHESVLLEKDAIENNCGCDFGCGIFQLRKN